MDEREHILTIEVVRDEDDGINRFAAILRDEPNASYEGYGETVRSAVLDSLRIGGHEAERNDPSSRRRRETARRRRLAERIRTAGRGHRDELVLRLTQGSIVCRVAAIETDGVRIIPRHISRDFVEWSDLRDVDRITDRKDEDR